MRNLFTYIIGILFFFIQSCCFGAEESAIDMVPRVTVTNAIRMKSNLDTIYKITYPNSATQFTPKSNKSKLLLSTSNEFTTLYISSTKGLDTIIIQTPTELLYESDKCESDYLAKRNFSQKLVSYTFDTCFFIQYSSGYNQKEIYDTLIVD